MSKNKPNKLQFDTNWKYAPALEGTDHIEIKDQYELFIGGEFVAPSKGKYFDTINPATEQRIASIAEASKKDVDRAVVAARKAYDKYWSKMSAKDRSKYIFRIARIMQEKARELEKR